MALSAAIAWTPTPALDRATARPFRAADHSSLSRVRPPPFPWAGIAGLRAATMGLTPVAVAASIVNLGVKPFGRRRGLDRAAEQVPVARHVRIPFPTSCPSGHSAGAFAFALGAGHLLPPVAIPLRRLAALVSCSPAHTGVHYPGDVVAGALMGTGLAQGTTHVLHPPARLTAPVARSCTTDRVARRQIPRQGQFHAGGPCRKTVMGNVPGA